MPEARGPIISSSASILTIQILLSEETPAVAAKSIIIQYPIVQAPREV